MIEIKKLKTIAVLELLTGIGIIMFWIGFFTIGLAPENPPQCYFAYEHSFPLPDIILSIAILASGILLLKKQGIGNYTFSCLLWRPYVPGSSRFQLQHPKRRLHDINSGFDSERLYQYLVRCFRLGALFEDEITGINPKASFEYHI